MKMKFIIFLSFTCTSSFAADISCNIFGNSVRGELRNTTMLEEVLETNLLGTLELMRGNPNNFLTPYKYALKITKKDRSQYFSFDKRLNISNEDKEVGITSVISCK